MRRPQAGSMAGSSRIILCVAHGRDQQWEAFALDFDLAVQARSYDEAKQRLEVAIRHYVESALAQPEPVRKQLLSRSVPLRTKLLWAWRIGKWALFHRTRAEESTVGFPVPCPA